MNYSKTARKLRAKIEKFSGELSDGLPRVATRFVSEMVYGIQASQSVVLTKIGRTLEESIPIKKTQWRLSRGLGRKGLDSHIQSSLLNMAKNLVKEDTLLILDPSDIRKNTPSTCSISPLFATAAPRNWGRGIGCATR